jgi:transposase
MPDLNHRCISKTRRYRHASGPDLRRQVVRLRDEEQRKWEEIADIVQYSGSTCHGWYVQYHETGLYCSNRVRKGAMSKLSLHAHNEMMLALQAHPNVYYVELQHTVWVRTGERVCVSTIGRMCRDAGYRNKRASNISLHRNKHAMREHALLRQQFHHRQFICVDEAHKAGRNLGRRYAKVRRGERAYVPLSEHLGQSWTVLAAMNYTGLVDCDVQELASTPDYGTRPRR